MISPEQDCDSGELDEALVVGQQLVVAGGDAAELLQLTQEPLECVSMMPLYVRFLVQAGLAAVRT